MDNSFKIFGLENEESRELLDDRFWKLDTNYFSEQDLYDIQDNAQDAVHEDIQEQGVNADVEEEVHSRPKRNIVPPDRYGKWEYTRLAASGSEDPKTLKQALSGHDSEQWKKAADEEYYSL